MSDEKRFNWFMLKVNHIHSNVKKIIIKDMNKYKKLGIYTTKE